MSRRLLIRDPQNLDRLNAVEDGGPGWSGLNNQKTVSESLFLVRLHRPILQFRRNFRLFCNFWYQAILRKFKIFAKIFFHVPKILIFISLQLWGRSSPRSIWIWYFSPFLISVREFCFRDSRTDRFADRTVRTNVSQFVDPWSCPFSLTSFIWAFSKATVALIWVFSFLKLVVDLVTYFGNKMNLVTRLYCETYKFWTIQNFFVYVKVDFSETNNYFFWKCLRSRENYFRKKRIWTDLW